MRPEAITIRYFDVAYSADSPPPGGPYDDLHRFVRGVAKLHGCRDGKRAQFEVRIGRRSFYVYVRSPHLPPEHHEMMAGLAAPAGYRFRAGEGAADDWRWLDLPASDHSEPSLAYAEAVEALWRHAIGEGAP